MRRPISRALRQAVLERDDYVCQYCGYAPEYLIWQGRSTLHVDHMMPWSRGGRDVIENLVTACPDCNLRKKAKLWVAPVAYCAGCGTFQRAVGVDDARSFTSHGPAWLCEFCTADTNIRWDEHQAEVDAWDSLALAAGF